jgi:outer membrane lipoprotein SlyB
MKAIFLPALLACAALAAGCASPAHPVLYPNAHLKQVGDAQAQQDIGECAALAESSGAEAKDAGRAVRPAAQGAAVGAAVGGVGQAIRGRSIVGGALAGGAIGGAAGGVRGAFRANEVSPIHRNFVQRCLHERGYDVIGWK